MHALETYLHDIHVIRSSGAAVKETSYYAPLRNLLNEVGRTLKPRVHCIVNLQDRGAGLPDGGLFTADQLQSSNDGQPAPGQMPARGAIEVKSAGEDAWVVADGEQVSRYWNKYGQVLVTNYRDFVLLGKDAEGQAAKLETFRIAGSEAAFWQAAGNPRKSAARLGDNFVEFLKRVMLHAAPLDNPRDLAWFLASYAREAKSRIEQSELPALHTIRRALEEALGMTFEGAKGDHFFRSTLVQTLFYGVFSAWVLWHKSHPPSARAARFEWKMAASYLRVPILRKLFYETAEPGQLDTLNLSGILDWAGATLNRVDRASFFAGFEEKFAVQYFYEPFLEAFDPELRKELGVWYTPAEIVEYMVERVDTVLREELGLPDGLADPRVYVLDPCCGTGAYLVAVLSRIAATLREKGDDALLSHELKQAAMHRIFGFEILPAPFVVSHLQLGLLLQHLGTPFSDQKKERAGVYLTNALTGWEPPKAPKPLPFVELEEERDAADEVKREKPILVVLGNPPYNSFAGIAKVDEERDLSTAYRTTKRAPAPQGQGLNDLYIRFFRMAERRIVEKSKRGVVCFISNYSWLDGLSFTGMRERYLEVFDRIWIDCLNGDKYKTGKLTPEGEPDPSVFSTEFNREGIQVGTAVSLLVRTKSAGPAEAVQFRHVWGRNKRAELLNGEAVYERVMPALALGLPFAPASVDKAYLSWPLLPELFPVSFPGVKTSRDDVVVDIDRERLVRRMEQYFDPAVSHEEMKRIAPGAMQDTSGFDAVPTRERLIQRGFLRQNVIRYCYRPFDVRWLYWEPETKLLDRNRAEYFPNVFDGNLWFAAVQQNRKDFDPPLFTGQLCSLHVIERGANLFPLYLRTPENSLLDPGAERTAPNLSPSSAEYLSCIGGSHDALFHHSIAVLHAPAYRDRNAGALRRDWPRIPLPAGKETLLASAALGRRIAALLDPECSPPIPPELRSLASIASGEGQLNPDEGDLEITAGWGHGGKGGITMPAKGKLIERDYSPRERDELGDAIDRLGSQTWDVYLNGKAYWRNVPGGVWEYTMGGYQVLKKWLSYREKELLGRSLTVDEARYFTGTARRIAAILIMAPALDANYDNVRQSCCPWPPA